MSVLETMGLCWFPLEMELIGTLKTLVCNKESILTSAGQDILPTDSNCSLKFGAAQDIGSFRAQSLKSLAGKILRIDPNTGEGKGMTIAIDNIKEYVVGHSH